MKEQIRKRWLLGLGLTAILVATIAATTVGRWNTPSRRKVASGRRPPVYLAQFRVPSGKRKPQTIDVFPAPPSDVRRPLMRALRAIDEGRYSDAVEHLDLLLNGFGSGDDAQDYFIESADGSGTRTSLKAEAQRLLGAMPAKGRQAYEVRYGARARLLLQQALDQGDIEKLADVTRRYFHTSAGYEAAILLGRYHLDHGRPLAAAICLKRVSDSPAAGSYEPELSLLLGTCWMYAGMPDRARDVLIGLRRLDPGATMRIGSADVRLFDEDEQALAWLSETVGVPQPPRKTHETQWVMYRGSASRNGRSAGGLPLAQLNWSFRTTDSEGECEVIEQQRRQYIAQGIAALPGLHPLVVRHVGLSDAGDAVYRDTVLARTPNSLMAIDAETGCGVWFYPPTGHNPSGTGDLSGGAHSGVPDGRSQELQKRTWEDAPYGQISTDGEFVFFVDDLATAGPKAGRTAVGFGPFGLNTGRLTAHNRLVALRLAEEGKIAWSIDGETGLIEGNGSRPAVEEELAGAFFLGPPLVRTGRLFTIAEIRGDIRLVVLHADSGRLLWTQQLCHIDLQTIQRSPTRRLAGATPSFSDGILICPTSAGAVVAVDVATHSLLWGYQYLTLAANKPSVGFGVVGPHTVKGPTELGSRWADATATIVDGRVLVTPVDVGSPGTEKLHCLNLLDGKLLWEKPREEMLYLACGHEGKVVMVGKSGLTALKLADGEVVWKAPLPTGSMPSGRGFYSDRFYFVPVTTAELVKIDLDTGKRIEQVETSGVLGNLICYQDKVISHGVTLVSASYQVEPLRKIIAQRLSENPEDIWALSRRGELLLHAGNRTEALSVLRKACKLAPDDPVVAAETKPLLIDALLDGLKEDFAANSHLVEEIESLLPGTDRRGRYLRVLAVGYQEIGQRTRAFTTYLRLVDLNATRADGLPPATATERIDDFLTVRRDRWFRGHVAELLAIASPAEREKMVAAVQEHLLGAANANDTASLRQFVDYFGSLPEANQVRLQLVTHLVEAGELLQAELVLGRLIESEEPAIAAQATAHLARLLESVGRFAQAAETYRILADKWGETVCLNGKTGQELFEAIDKGSETAREIASAGDWPFGKVTANEGGPALPYSSYQRVFPVKVEQRRGAYAKGISVAVDQQRNLVVCDGLGKQMARVALPRDRTTHFYSNNFTLSQARIDGHVVVLSLGYEIFAIDVLQSSENPSDRVLWRKNRMPLTSQANYARYYLRTRAVNNPWGTPRYVPTSATGQRVSLLGPLGDHGLCFQQFRQVMCVDPLDVETVYWTRENVEPGSDLFGDDELLLVVGPGATEAMVLGAVDGRVRGRCGVPSAEYRWTTIGRRILTWKESQNAMTVQLLDPFDPKKNSPREDPVVWSRDFALGSKGKLVDSDALGVMQRDGKFVVLSLADGSEIIKAQLDPDGKLTEICLLRSEDQYLLVTNHPATGTTPTKTVQAVPPGANLSGQLTPLINGRAYAFDRHTGEAMWPGSAVIEQHGLPLDQPSELPVLTFLSTAKKTGPGSNSEKTSVLCLDRRDGHIVFSKDDITNRVYAYQLVGNREENTVVLMLHNKSYTIKLTDEPRPPAPPAQTGSSSSLHAGGSLGSILGKVGRALGRSLHSAVAEPEKADP